MELFSEELSVVHPLWGRIYVRNKRPAHILSFPSRRVVILQHGATYGSAAFDLPFGGISWMDYIAAKGFDVYCFDLPGYGRSERPPQMTEPAGNNPPFMHTPEAADCLDHVVEFVCKRRDVDQLCLIGWSWGTAIAGYYTERRGERVERLTLYAPVWDRRGSTPSTLQMAGTLGAYRIVTKEATLNRRQNGLTEQQASTVMPREWFELWWETTAAADPDATPGTIRAPNGVIEDSRNYWSTGRHLYDPSRILCPVLVIVGEWDLDTKPELALSLYPEMTNTSWKRLVVIGGGTHAMMMEANRMLLFRSVQQFLEESAPGVDAID
ncbi:MAG: alpha/beta hydrolase [Hyphomicrobiaceae bacterium]